MRFRLTPRDTSFFDMFATAAGNLVEGASLLTELIAIDRSERERVVEAMRDVEHRADDVTHEIMRRLNSTFVTPFDREDIHALATALDDCMDEMDAAADLIVLYRLDGMPSGVAEQVSILRRQAELTRDAMPRLHSMEDLAEYWIEIDRLENQGDHTFRQMLADLFDQESDAIELMKVKEVIEVLERAVDAFETVAHRVETIAVKES
jgi:predicted phosphate transport protein (TIGR00153 family)